MRKEDREWVLRKGILKRIWDNNEGQSILPDRRLRGKVNEKSCLRSARLDRFRGRRIFVRERTRRNCAKLVKFCRSQKVLSGTIATLTSPLPPNTPLAAHRTTRVYDKGMKTACT